MRSSLQTSVRLTLGLLPVLLLTPVGVRAAVDPCQTAVESMPIGFSPVNGGTILRDLEGDGDLDLIASSGGNPVEARVFRNDGAEQFTQVAVLPGHLVRDAGDLDGDGLVDLLLSGTPTTPTFIARGLSIGGFGPPEPLTLPRGPLGLLLDVDGDNDLDFVSVEWLVDVTTRIRIHLNDGAASFSQSDEALASGRVFDLIAADLNNDGILDLATIQSVQNHGLVKLYLDGVGNIDSTEFVPLSPLSLDIQAADLDGAPPIDLIVSSYDGNASVFFGDGTEYSLPIGSAMRSSTELFDFDNDGELDFLSHRINEIGIQFGIGGGSFGDYITLANETTPAIAAGDLNGDGIDDLASNRSIFWNRTLDFEDCDQNGVPDRCDILTDDCNGNGIPDACDLASGTESDLNMDGVPDVCQLFRRGEANGDESLNLSDAVFILAQLFTSPVSSDCEDASDFNDDGAVDISDAVGLLAFLFVPSSPPPLPPGLNCGIDPTADGLDCASPPECL